MKVRVFLATGYEDLRQLQNRINEWLSAEEVEVKHVDSAMCQIGVADEGDRYQSYVMTVWYD